MYGLTDLLADPTLAHKRYQLTPVQASMPVQSRAMAADPSQNMDQGQSPAGMGGQLGGLMGSFGKAPGMGGQGMFNPATLAQQANAGPAMQMAGVDMGSLTAGLPGAAAGPSMAAGGATMGSLAGGAGAAGAAGAAGGLSGLMPFLAAL